MLPDTANGALQPAVVRAAGGAERKHLTGRGVVHIKHRGKLRLTPTHHLLANSLLVAERAWLVKDFPLQVRREVLLGHPVVTVGMRIEIPGTVPKTLSIATRILEVRRHLALALLLHHA